MKFTPNIAFASFLAKAIFSVIENKKTPHLDKSCKMINAYGSAGADVDIMPLT